MYKIKQAHNQRWGIYLQDRLLATIGNYETGEFIMQFLSHKLSHKDNSKSAIAHKKAIFNRVKYSVET